MENWGSINTKIFCGCSHSFRRDVFILFASPRDQISSSFNSNLTSNFPMIRKKPKWNLVPKLWLAMGSLMIHLLFTFNHLLIEFMTLAWTLFLSQFTRVSWRSIIISSLVVVLRRELLRWHHSISHRIVSQQLKTKNFILFNLNQLMCLLTTLCWGFVRVTMTLVLREFDFTERVCSKRKLNLFDEILRSFVSD